MRRFLGLVGGVVLGLVLSQFPEYAQQYTQRLGGAVDELRVITQDFDRRASNAGLSREQAFARFDGSPDAFIADHGASIEATFLRYEDLRQTLEEIQGATAVQRFARLPDYLDSEIGQRTLESFQPAVPVTTEGFAYAGVGFVTGYILMAALATLIGLPFRRRRYIAHLDTRI